MGDSRDQEIGKANNGRDQKAGKVGDSRNQKAEKASDIKDQKAGKANDSGVVKNIEISNNNISDGTRNQDNLHVTVEEIEDFDDCITIVVDLAIVDIVFANILVYLFDPSSTSSNLPLGIITACFGQSNL